MFHTPVLFHRPRRRHRIDKGGLGALQLGNGIASQRFQELPIRGQQGKVIQLVGIIVKMIDFFSFSADQVANVLGQVIADNCAKDGSCGFPGAIPTGADVLI